MASGSTLIAIPFDLLHLILVFCNVQDILMLRMCCSTLERVTRSRSIWVQALRNVKDLTGACYLERDIRKMNQKKLEQAATAYLRFRKTAESQCVHSRNGDNEDASASPLLPYVSRILIQEDVRGAHHIHSMKLVPGGRYLLSIAMQTLQLWDLGVNFHSALPNRPLATENCPFEKDLSNPFNRNFPSIDCYVENDGTVQILLREYAYPSTILLRYEVVIGRSTTKFTFLGKYRAPFDTFSWFGRNMPTLWVSEESNYTGVWDPKSRAAVQWKSTESRPPRKMAAYDGHLVYWDRAHVSFTRIPNLCPLVSEEAEEIPEPEFYKIFWEPDTDEKRSTVVLPPTQPSGFFMFDMVDCGYASQEWLVTLHKRIVLSHDQQAKSPFSIVQRHQNDYPDIDISEDEMGLTISSFHYPDGYRLLFWLSNHKPPRRHDFMPRTETERTPYIGLVFSDITGEVRPWSEVFLYIRTLKHHENAWSFCPISGRVCVGEENEIRIVDYVTPFL